MEVTPAGAVQEYVPAVVHIAESALAVLVGRIESIKVTSTSAVTIFLKTAFVFMFLLYVI
jgi:hypothetical protein